MSLPFVIANLPTGNNPGADLDANFNAVAAMAVTQCTATGSNSIVLTPNSNQSPVTAYNNYQRFGFVAAASSTGSLTANVNSLGSLPVYLPDGVTQAGAGNIASGVYYDVVYNLALNSGSGGLQMTSLYTSSVSPVFSAISGCLPSSISGTNTTASLSVSSGQATDSTNAAYIKSTGYSWAVSNGNAINGYQGGTTLPNSSTIHFYVCNGASGTGVFASTSLTPTLPSGYNSFSRRIFSLNTNSSGALLPGTAIETWGGSYRFYLATQILDINTSVQGTSRILYTLTVPSGIRVRPIPGPMSNFLGSGGSQIKITSGDETDVAPAGPTTVPMFDVWGFNNNSTTTSPDVTTNTSGQIGARGSTTGMNFNFTNRGFDDWRRV